MRRPRLPRGPIASSPALRAAVAVAALSLALVSLWRLEAAREGLAIEALTIGTTPATLYRPSGRGAAEGAPVVVVAHGFAGSRRMMEAFSLTLARSGIAALAFDFEGHGRNPVPMRGSVGSIDGVTARLVAETREVVDAARAIEGVGPPVALLGHSMATDVILRAAEAEGIAAVVAVSMYSDAVTPTRPERLLVASGAREGRLRAHALEAVREVASGAGEGETVREGAVQRRAIAAPLVGHVGVLWSPAALREARDWIAAASGRPTGGPVARTGPWLAGLLGAVVALSWPLARLLPRAEGAQGPALGAGRLAAALVLPALAGAGAALLMPSPTLGLRGAGGLAAYLLVLGAGQMALLWRWGVPLGRPDALASAALLAWAAAFAWALDRYGASFALTGPRWELGALLLPGAALVALADGALTRGAPIWRVAAIRAAPLAGLLAAMLLAPGRLGLQFTALPVLVLFWLVFGTMAGRVAARRGQGAPRLALGLVLAFSLAASLPLFG